MISQKKEAIHELPLFYFYTTITELLLAILRQF